MYEKVLLDKEYLAVMIDIEKIKFITDGKWDWEHGIGHAKRVANYIKTILVQLGCDDRTIDLGMVCGLLHDIGLSKGKKADHAIESCNLAMSYLKKLELNNREFKLILQSILDHSNGNNIKSNIGAALLLADKLDITYHRIENSSIKDKLNSEIEKIKNVEVKLSKAKLTVEYTAVDNFDPFILKDWDRTILIPIRFAKYLHKECVFKLNEKEYNFLEILK